MITFKCSSCGNVIRAQEQLAGRKGPCKKCGQTVQVPNQPPQETGVIQRPVEPSSQRPTDVLAGAGKKLISVATAKVEEIRRNDDPALSIANMSPLIGRLSNDDQDPKIVARLTEKVESILMQGEQIFYIAVQQRPIANFAPDAVVLTNKRFMVFRTKLLGRLDFDDYVWRNLHDCRLRESVLGATISIVTAPGKRLSIGYLPKKQAREVYRFAQEMEEKSLDDRRQRELEEARARAGGVVIHDRAPNSPTDGDPVSKLQQLKSMADSGLITSEEYEAKKAQILSQM